MLAKSKPVCFIPTKDAKRARAFFEKMLGLKFVSDDKFALVFNAGGNMLRVVRVQEFTPLPFTILGWEVKDIAKTAEALTAKKVTFERYGFMKQDELGIWDAPGGAKVAWFKDPDGNLLSISQH
jgi:catechol 2,3-dioxygenase-like lactoylglutathione lyase family enzyme